MAEPGPVALSVIVRSLLGAIAMTLMYLGGLRWERVKARSMRVANWIDRKTLRAVQFLRAPMASNSDCARSAATQYRRPSSEATPARP